MKIKSYNDRSIKNWVSSDLHLGHKKEFIWKKRGYNSPEEHDRGVISKINKLVLPYDNLWYLGDFCLNTSEQQFESYLSQISCQNINLIWGNHPNPIYKIYRKLVAEIYGDDQIEVYPFRYKNINFLGYHYECVIQGRYVVFNHFPISVWENMKDGAYMLCGHSHYSYPDTRIESINGLTLDCGWDGHGQPLLFDDIIRIMNKKQIRQVDHHVKGI
jgi:calcineurin-like phosphoesterase family protein